MESFNPKRLKMSEEESCSTHTKGKASFNFASSDFSKIVKTEAFVDKTLLVKAIFNESPMIVITAPRRFGKSTNMDMVRKFVEIQVDESGAVIDKENPGSNYNIFKDNNLLIYQHEDFFKQYFATYPVVQISFKCLFGRTFDEILVKFRKVLHETFAQHKYLLNSDKLDSVEIMEYQSYYGTSYKSLDQADIEAGLKFLSGCLYKHFDKKQVFVFIDEYDAPITNTMFKKNIDINDVNELLYKIFSETLKENRYVERALLTGISYFATVGLSGANNIDKYMFLEDDNPFVKFYGLTESEVEVLFSKFNVNKETKEKAKSYYNGYCTQKGYNIFSLWSVFKFLTTNSLKSYWEQSGLAFGLRKALRVPVVEYAIEELFRSIPVRIKILTAIEIEDIIELKEVVGELNCREVSDPDVYLNFLLQQGYLTYVEKEKGPVTTQQPLTANESYIKIPNNEIRERFERGLKNYYKDCFHKLVMDCAVVIDQMSSTSNHEFYHGLIKKFESVISHSEQKFIKENERVFHSCLTAVILATKFCLCDENLFSNMEGIKGHARKPDLVITKGNLGVIIEMKYKEDSMNALKQIIDKKYFEIFNIETFKKVEEKIYLGVNVNADFKVTVGVLNNSLKLNDAIYYPIKLLY